MCRGWIFHRTCEKLGLVKLCQPGGQKSVMFAGLYSNQALCREIRKKEMVHEETEHDEGVQRIQFIQSLNVSEWE